MSHKINIILFGIGATGSALINKVQKERKNLEIENRIAVRFPVITNTTVAFFEKEGANFSWEANFIQFGVPFKMEDILLYVIDNELENVVIVDATPSLQLTDAYIEFLRSGFSVVSINENLKLLPESFEKGARFLADTYGGNYKFITTTFANKDLAANALFDGVLQVAEKKRKVA